MRGYSRYGGQGKGLTDRATRAFSRRLKVGSKRHRDYTTHLTKGGIRKARGSFQIMGMTAASMGYGTGMSGFKVTGDTGLSGWEFMSKYRAAGRDTSGDMLFVPREGSAAPKQRPSTSAPGARTMSVGAPKSGNGSVLSNFGFGSSGGMGASSGGAGQAMPSTGGRVDLLSVAFLGGAGYVVWRMLK